MSRRKDGLCGVKSAIWLMIILASHVLEGFEVTCIYNSDCTEAEHCVVINQLCQCLPKLFATDLAHCNSEEDKTAARYRDTISCQMKEDYCRLDEVCVDEGTAGCVCASKILLAGRNVCRVNQTSFQNFLHHGASNYNLLMIGIPVIFAGIIVPLLCCIVLTVLRYKKRFLNRRRQLESAISSGEPAPILPKPGTRTQLQEQQPPEEENERYDYAGDAPPLNPPGYGVRFGRNPI